DPPAALPVDRDEVWKVVLALRILRRNAADRVEEPLEREGVDAGIDLLDLALPRGRVLFLNNPCNLLAGRGIANDPSVAARVVDDRGHDRCRGARRYVAVHQRFQ